MVEETGSPKSLAPGRWLCYYDGNCGFCRGIVRRLSRLDVFGRVDWIPSQSLEEPPEGLSWEDLESALYLQGLCDRVAEDLAEYIHNLLRMRSGQKKEKQGQRYSPGYAALADMTNNRMIWEILKAGDLGISLTGADEFDPPSTTAAVVCFHRDASYS